MPKFTPTSNTNPTYQKSPECFWVLRCRLAARYSQQGGASVLGKIPGSVTATNNFLHSPFLITLSNLPCFQQ